MPGCACNTFVCDPRARLEERAVGIAQGNDMEVDPIRGESVDQAQDPAFEAAVAKREDDVGDIQFIDCLQGVRPRRDVALNVNSTLPATFAACVRSRVSLVSAGRHYARRITRQAVPWRRDAP